MGALNYHHISEDLLRFPLITIPTSLLFQFQQGYVPWIIVAVLGLQSVYEHSSTTLNIDWLGYIYPNNRYHRIHHFRETQHFNKNFGSASTLWDFMFGTLYRPNRLFKDALVGLRDHENNAFRGVMTPFESRTEAARRQRDLP
jgi:sterol desaturase/sphingolipid hydroxylase (fatty acid hydroxylase superfamily)